MAWPQRPPLIGRLRPSCVPRGACHARPTTIKVLKEYLREEAKAKRGMKVEDGDLRGINANGIPVTLLLPFERMTDALWRLS
jgi:hypothetical protein